MIVTAWNNGWFQSDGSGYGLLVNDNDREKYFSIRWNSVRLSFPAKREDTQINIDNSLFRFESGGILMSQAIGLWLIEAGFSSWVLDEAPRVVLEPQVGSHFKIIDVLG
ncbi:MAG: hypothetical protein AAF420_07290, partial [Pseudomonadota bacterium]